MISFAALLASFAFVAPQDRPVVKLTTVNGANVYARRIDEAKTFSLALAIVSTRPSEVAETHGIRHVLEHLAAKGANHDVDKMLEAKGMVLKAETTRDAIVFQIDGEPADFNIALDAMRKVISFAQVSQEELDKEKLILRQESALRPWSLQLVSDAWLKAFGEAELDPFGSPDAIDKLTPEAVSSSWKLLLDPACMCLAAAGKIDAESATKAMSEVLQPLEERETNEPRWRLPGKAPVFAGSLDGETVGVPVGPVTNPETVATIGAAFGLRAWLPDCLAIYTASAKNGLVTVALRSGLTWRNAGLQLAGKEAMVSQTGMRLLQSWKNEIDNDPTVSASLMATLLPLRPAFRIEALVTAIDGCTRNDVQSAVKAFIKTGVGE